MIHIEEEKLYEIIMSENLTWEGLIRDIVISEGLNPLDIDISRLTNIYLSAIKKMKELDLRVSGKFLLTAAILLKMKADYMFEKKEEKEEKKEEIIKLPEEAYELEQSIPLPKERKLTLDELITALKKAVEVKKRREIRRREKQVEMKVNIKKVDLTGKIKNLYEKIVSFFEKFKTNEITFSQLIPSKKRLDQIWTFIPLIHLANRGKVNLRQEKVFGEIYVRKREGSD